MSLFVDKNHRRKSPIAIAGFFATVLFLCVYGVLYALLAEPLYRHVALSSPAATNVAHALIISLAGTALCGLLFLLKDKRVALFGFVGLAVVLVMFYVAAFLMEDSRRDMMLPLITLYGLAPALVGNAAAWPLYLKLRKTHPLPQQKTLREEIREAAEKSGGRVVRKAPQEEPAGAARRASPEEDAMLLYGDDGENAG